MPVVAAHYQQVNFQPGGLGKNFLGCATLADPGLQLSKAVAFKPCVQINLCMLLLLRVRLACQNVQHAQSCSGLLRQLRRAAQGQVGLGAEIVGDKNMLNHGGLAVC